MTAPATSDLIASSSQIAADLESQIAAYPEVGPAVRGASQVIRVAVATARTLRIDLVRRCHLAASLEIAGSNIVSAIDRHPEVLARATSLRDDGLACLSLAMAAREAP